MELKTLEEIANTPGLKDNMKEIEIECRKHCTGQQEVISYLTARLVYLEMEIKKGGI